MIRAQLLDFLWARGMDVRAWRGLRSCRARRHDRLVHAPDASDLKPNSEDLVRIERAVPAAAVAGTRYDAHQMAILDSERA